MNRYENVKYNGILLSEFCEVEDVKIPVLTSREISILEVASRDGDIFNGAKYNSYKIEITVIIDCDTKVEYEEKLKNLRNTFNVNTPQKLYITNDKFIYAITNNEVEKETEALYSYRCVIPLYCPIPYFFSEDIKSFDSEENNKIKIENRGNKPTLPFVSIGFSKDSYFAQLELQSTGQRILVGKYPKLDLGQSTKSNIVLNDSCQSTSGWTKSVASIDSDRSTEGTLGITSDGSGFCLSNPGSGSTTWKGCCYRKSLDEVASEFEVEAYFTHESTGINGDPTNPDSNSSTTVSGTKTEYYKVSCSSLNIRTGPGTNYKKLGSVKRGFEITNGTKVNGWLKFRYESKYPGKDCYCSLSYLTKMVKDSTVTTTVKNMVTKFNSALKPLPTGDSTCIKTIPIATTLRINMKEYNDVSSDGIKRIYYKLDKPYDGTYGYTAKGNLVDASNLTIDYANKEDLNTSDDKLGEIMLYGFGPNGERIFSMGMRDDSKYFEYTYPVCKIGAKTMLDEGDKVPPPKSESEVVTDDKGNSTMKITNYLSGTYGSWNNFFGKLKVTRKKVGTNFEWNFEICKIVDGKITKNKTVSNMRSIDFPSEDLSYLVIYIATNDTLTKCSDMAIKDIKVQKLNESTEPPTNVVLFKQGDILDIDFENHKAYLNHSNCNYLVDVGSRFFELPSGEDLIKINSDDNEISVNAVIREKWLGGD